MNRRGFLGSVSGAAVALVPASGVLGEIATPTRILAGVPLVAGVTGISMPTDVYFMLWQLINASETARSLWYELWRQHRRRVRRHAENRLPAQVVWFRAKLRTTRRMQHQSRTGIARAITPMRDKSFYRRRARFLNAFKVAKLDPPRTWI